MKNGSFFLFYIENIFKECYNFNSNKKEKCYANYY